VPCLTLRGSAIKVAIPKLSARVADARLDGALTVEQTAGGLHAGGPVTAQVPSLRRLLGELGVEASLPRDRETLGSLGMTGIWAFNDGALAVKPLTMQIDATKLTGWVERSNAAEAVWSFDLHGDHIDLDRYVHTEGASKKPFELPVDALRALRAQGTVVFDHAQLAGAQMKNARLSLEENTKVQHDSAAKKGTQ
jgi:hypothetical protein